MNVYMRNNSILYSLMILIVILVGVLAYESHFYSQYFMISAFFVIILSMYIASNKMVTVKIEKKWLVVFILYFVSYITSIIYNTDFLGFIRLIVTILIMVIYFFSIKYIDSILEKLLFILIPTIAISFLIQFTSILNPVWNFVDSRNSTIFFDPNFASVFLGLGALIALSFFEGKVIRQKIR